MKRSRKEHDNKWCSGHKKCYKIVKICDRYHPRPCILRWKMYSWKIWKIKPFRKGLGSQQKREKGTNLHLGKKFKVAKHEKRKIGGLGRNFFILQIFLSSLSSHHVLPPIFSLKVSSPRIFHMVKDHSSITIILITIIR